MAKRGQQKMNVGTDESFLKVEFQEIVNNGEKCGWLKQMQVADEKHDSNKWWPYIAIQLVSIHTASTLFHVASQQTVT